MGPDPGGGGAGGDGLVGVVQFELDLEELAGGVEDGIDDDDGGLAGRRRLAFEFHGDLVADVDFSEELLGGIEASVELAGLDDDGDGFFEVNEFAGLMVDAEDGAVEGAADDHVVKGGAFALEVDFLFAWVSLRFSSSSLDWSTASWRWRSSAGEPAPASF